MARMFFVSLLVACAACFTPPHLVRMSDAKLVSASSLGGLGFGTQVKPVVERAAQLCAAATTNHNPPPLSTLHDDIPCACTQAAAR